MNLIYHDNQLLGTQLTEWPKKPEKTEPRYGTCYSRNVNCHHVNLCPNGCEHAQGMFDDDMADYEKAITAALAQSFPVVEEEQEVLIEMIVKQFIFPDGYGMVRFGAHHQFQDDTLYSLDIEMEEVEQAKVNNEWLEVNRINEPKSNFIEYRTALRIKKEKPTMEERLIRESKSIDPEIQKIVNDKFMDMISEQPTMNQEPDKKEEEPNWEKLKAIQPPENIKGAPLRGAWLEGQMVGYAQAQSDIKYWRQEYFKLKSLSPAQVVEKETLNINSDGLLNQYSKKHEGAWKELSQSPPPEEGQEELWPSDQKINEWSYNPGYDFADSEEEAFQIGAKYLRDLYKSHYHLTKRK